MTHVSRQVRQAIARQNMSRPVHLTEVPLSEWPASGARGVSGPSRVLASRSFLVQVFLEEGGVLRLSVNRTTVRADGRWDDGITWDELMQVKREAGFGDLFAVEVYPEDRSVVDVANMRHLWILPEAPTFAWRRQ